MINFHNIYQRWRGDRSLQLTAQQSNNTKMNENFQHFGQFADKLKKCNWLNQFELNILFVRVYGLIEG